jgi:hypothetical protein
MNHSQNNSDDDSITGRVTSLRDSVPDASVESQLQLHMQDHWESLGTRSRKNERLQNKFKIWVAVSAAAVLLLSTAIVFLQRDKHVLSGMRRNNPDSTGATLEFNPSLSKETDPCNILPPLADWRS